MADNNHVDEKTGIETTGHVWDGIRELNNPLPRWWLWTFYATIIWSLGYMILYPAWPLIESATPGILGYSSRAELAQEMEAAQAAQADRIEAIRTSDVATINADADLRQFAISAGNSAFKVHCSQCHGSGAAGGPGYPNLNDDAWIWGGTIEDIHFTITHGVRNETDDARYSEMPAFGRDGILNRDEITQAAWYVKSLSDSSVTAGQIGDGATVFADNCSVCHGESGEGMPELGAPRLSDPIWLYGGSHEDIVAQVTSPKHGVMPAWGLRLPEVTVKELAVYVHNLGGGQ